MFETIVDTRSIVNMIVGNGTSPQTTEENENSVSPPECPKRKREQDGPPHEQPHRVETEGLTSHNKHFRCNDKVLPGRIRQSNCVKQFVERKSLSLSYILTDCLMNKTRTTDAKMPMHKVLHA